MAHLRLGMARLADSASPGRFAGGRFMRARSDVLPCKPGTKAKQQLSLTNALEPVGVPV